VGLYGGWSKHEERGGRPGKHGVCLVAEEEASPASKETPTIKWGLSSLWGTRRNVPEGTHPSFKTKIRRKCRPKTHLGEERRRERGGKVRRK